MKKLTIPFLLSFLFITSLCFGQSSGDQWKKSSSNPTGLQYDNMAPKEKPLAPEKSIKPAEERTHYSSSGSDAYMTWPNKKAIDDCRVKGINAKTEKKYAKAEQYFLQAIDLIGLDNYAAYRAATVSFRPDDFFLELIQVREFQKNDKGAAEATDVMMKYDPEQAESIRKYREEHGVKTDTSVKR